MFTPHSSKSTIDRVAASLKLAVVLVLLGLIVVATERPMLLSPAGAVTVSHDAAYVTEQAKTRAGAAPETSAVTSAADGFVYFPSQFSVPTGPVEDLPPQF